MKQIILMRTDLGMRKGKMIAQGCHASLKATLENMEHPSVKEWLKGPFKKIVVKIDSEAELMSRLTLAYDSDLVCALITDAGFTEFHGIPTITCGAIGPATDEELEPITGDLKLL